MRTAQRIASLLVGGRALVLAATTAVALTLLVFSGSALALGPPTIDSVSVSGITQHDATLEAQISPNRLETTYEFHLTSPACQSEWPIIGPCFAISVWALPGGSILAGSGEQTVGLDLKSAGVTLHAGTWYEYSVSASNADGKVPAGGWEGTQQSFKTLSGNAPVIAGLEPNHGPTSGGTRVIIHGEPLENARSVHFGTVEGKIIEEECGGECEIMPYRTLVVESPPYEAGTVDVTVETAQGVSATSPGDEFTYGPSGGPSIESESVSNITPTDATLEAQIDTEGLPALYQFKLSSICGGRGECLVVINYPLPSGLLLGSFIDQSVSLDLNSAGVTLEPGGTYTYSVSATSSAGTTESSAQTLTTFEEGVEPLTGTTTSTPSGAGQPGDSSSGEQPAGSGGSSPASSPTPGIEISGVQVWRPADLGPPTREQKLAKALKACEKKPKNRRAACKAKARRKYGTSGELARSRK